VESGLPYELSKYQYFRFSDNLTEIVNCVNPFRKSTLIPDCALITQ